jgi:hypothetical protein
MSPQRTEQIARYELVHGERFEWRLVECVDIEIPQHPHPAPPPSRHSSASDQAPVSHIRSRRQADQGDVPHGGGRDSESTRWRPTRCTPARRKDVVSTNRRVD